MRQTEDNVGSGVYGELQTIALLLEFDFGYKIFQGMYLTVCLL